MLSIGRQAISGTNHRGDLKYVIDSYDWVDGRASWLLPQIFLSSQFDALIYQAGLAPSMFGRLNYLPSGKTLGKAIGLGCVAGAAASVMSTKRTDYRGFLAAKLAVIGGIYYFGKRAAKRLAGKDAKKG